MPTVSKREEQYFFDSRKINGCKKTTSNDDRLFANIDQRSPAAPGKANPGLPGLPTFLMDAETSSVNRLRF